MEPRPYKLNSQPFILLQADRLGQSSRLTAHTTPLQSAAISSFHIPYTLEQRYGQPALGSLDQDPLDCLPNLQEVCYEG